MPMLREIILCRLHHKDLKIIIDQEYALINYELNFDTSLTLTESYSQVLFNDEITEIKFLKDPYILLSTNSEILKILNTDDSKYELILGHSDIIVALDVHVSEDYTVVISGAKDNTIRLWKVTYEPLQVSCLAIYEGHTMNITSLSIDPKKGNYFVSVSLDKTLKKWGINEHLQNSNEK